MATLGSDQYLVLDPLEYYFSGNQQEVAVSVEVFGRKFDQRFPEPYTEQVKDDLECFSLDQHVVAD